MLGFITDKNLTFAPQTKDLAIRARQRLCFLRSFQGRAMVYKAFVRPRLESGSLAWMGAVQTNLKWLYRVLGCRNALHCTAEYWGCWAHHWS